MIALDDNKSSSITPSKLFQAGGSTGADEENAAKKSMQDMMRLYPMYIPNTKNNEKLWKLMKHHMPIDSVAIQKVIVNHVEYTLAKNRFTIDKAACYRATALSVRDRILELLNDSNCFFIQRDVKRCYYLSHEYSLGRTLQTALVNLELEKHYRSALAELGYDLHELYEFEPDISYGDGGLGRYSTSVLDSLATGNYPGGAYGIRYTYGAFYQLMENGYPKQCPDYSLIHTNEWEICRFDVKYTVRFGGTINATKDEHGQEKLSWTGGELVQALAYDRPISGFETCNAINLRLWQAVPYDRNTAISLSESTLVVEAGPLQVTRTWKNACDITAVPYTSQTAETSELKLKQEYLFVSATMQDIVRRFKKRPREWRDLPTQIAVQINGTNPVLAIPEFIRILIDVEGVDWELAKMLCRSVFSYTHHTTTESRLEKWSVALLEKILPRHLQIINDINFQFLNELRFHQSNDLVQLIRDLSLYEETEPKQLRMTFLAIICSSKTNAISRLQATVLRRELFPHFIKYHGFLRTIEHRVQHQFICIDSGVSPRRWLHNANRPLSNLITNRIGSSEWHKQFTMIAGLLNHSDDPDLIREWISVKTLNKHRLLKRLADLNVLPDGAVQPERTLFDMQATAVKEYKRQQMNLFHVIHRYLKIKQYLKATTRTATRNLTPPTSLSSDTIPGAVKVPIPGAVKTPRLVLLAGQAGLNDERAGLVIRMINAMAEIIDQDVHVHKYLRLRFVPDYNTSLTAMLAPGADVYQQVSTPGYETSGLSTFKFAMNGALILTSYDSASSEIVEEAGPETAFLFGASKMEVDHIRRESHLRSPWNEFDEVCDFIRQHLANGRDRESVLNFIDSHYAINGDYFLTRYDFKDYCRAQNLIDEYYQDQQKWSQRSIQLTASMGKFSSDAMVHAYASKIWDVEPMAVALDPPPVAGGAVLNDFSSVSTATSAISTSSGCAEPGASINASLGGGESKYTPPMLRSDTIMPMCLAMAQRGVISTAHLPVDSPMGSSPVESPLSSPINPPPVDNKVDETVIITDAKQPMTEPVPIPATASPSSPCSGQSNSSCGLVPPSKGNENQRPMDGESCLAGKEKSRSSPRGRGRRGRGRARRA